MTGLTPAEHGIVGNEFPDPGRDRWYALRDRAAVGDGSYYGGEPVWVTAERDRNVPGETRVDQVLGWLAEPTASRPRFITLYFESVDTHSHRFGVGSAPFRTALDDVDRTLGRLLDGIDRLPHGESVYVVLVSDHGQMGYRDDPPFVLEDHLHLEDLTLIDQGSAVYAWQERRDPAAAAKLALDS